MSNQRKLLIQKLYDLNRNDVSYNYQIYMTGQKINGITTIILANIINIDDRQYPYYINIKYPSRFNTIDNGSECIEDTIWLKEEYLNPTIATDILLYHIYNIDYLKKNIYNCFVKISDILKNNDIVI